MTLGNILLPNIKYHEKEVKSMNTTTERVIRMQSGSNHELRRKGG